MDVRKHALDIKQRIGYIPEQAAIYDVLTPIEYLRFIGRLYGLSEEVISKKSWELLRLFELSDKAETRMNTYSKGMKQKVIFLYEPLCGLDANAVILVKEILSQLKHSGKTIFYSSHIMDVVEKISDRIVIIDKGAVVADGSFETLQQQAHKGTLENIFTSLTGGDQQNTSTAKEFIHVLNS
jgi:ABC-2 type transport system ATP-binding protein